MFSTQDELVVLYSYDNVTKAYNGSFDYWWVKGTGLAANSTLDKPPVVQEGFIAVFEDTHWNVVENNYGTVVYSTSTKQPTVVDYFGEVNEGYTKLVPTEFDSWTGSCWEDLRTDEEKYAVYLTSLTRRQFRRTLVLNGFDLEAIKQTIGTIEDQQERQLALIDWEDATTFERTNPTVELMVQLLGLTEDQVNTMWQEALTY